jgi:DNA-binding CsgD family transcriptional regulator
LRRSGKRRIFEGVPSATRVGHRDLHAVLALVSEAAAADGGQPFERHTIERLLRMIPADRGGYFEYRNGGIVCGEPSNDYLVDVPAESDLVDWRSETVAQAVASWPLRDSEATIRAGALKLSDFLTGSRLRRNMWYREVMVRGGVAHELKVWLPSSTHSTCGFFLVRASGTRDFDERDRAVLDVLRPHLTVVRERWERRRRPTGLTDREAQVLELVARGSTNQEIAETLVISRTTVRTHLENIFEKLDVHTRTAAVARLREIPRRDG